MRLRAQLATISGCIMAEMPELPYTPDAMEDGTVVSRNKNDRVSELVISCGPGSQSAFDAGNQRSRPALKTAEKRGRCEVRRVDHKKAEDMHRRGRLIGLQFEPVSEAFEWY
jgi:hypothetical protein